MYFEKKIPMFDNLLEYYRKSDGATKKKIPWLQLCQKTHFLQIKSCNPLSESVSVRVSFEEKEMRVFAIALALALTLTLFLYPEPAGWRAGLQKLQPVW